MFTATIKSKEKVGGAIRVTVEFSDGTTSVTETCVPQDRNGFVHWVKSRLATFNGADELDQEYAENDTVDIAEPTPVEPTQEEKDFAEWMRKFRRLQTVQELVDLGIVANDNPKVVALRNDLQSTIKVTYIDNL